MSETVALYRKKPQHYEARQFIASDNGPELAVWCGGTYTLTPCSKPPHEEEVRLPGGRIVHPGDWIVYAPWEFGEPFSRVNRVDFARMFEAVGE